MSSSMPNGVLRAVAGTWIVVGALNALVDSSGLHAADFFVAVDGSPRGDGSNERPWDLPTALARTKHVAAGDTVCLAEGTYGGAVECLLAGSAEKPIVVRARSRQRAVIDCRAVNGRSGLFTIRGPDVRFQDLEFTCSDTLRSSSQTGSFPTDVDRGGIHAAADRISLVNLIIHDVGVVGLWSQGESGEVYGCVIFNNGWRAADRGHGHGIYTQNVRGTKRLVDNVIFNQFGHGIHAYGSKKAVLEGYHIEGNILFNNGAAAGTGHRTVNLLVGGDQSADRISVVENVSYHAGCDHTTVQLGYGPPSRRIEVRRNYFAGFVRCLPWEQATVLDNTFVAGSSMIELHAMPGFRSRYDWNRNTYFAEEKAFAPFAVLEAARRTSGRWNEWRAETGFDADGSYVKGPARGRHVIVRPNRYEPGRAHVAVFNWDRAPEVDVDLSGVLNSGERYRIVAAADVLGPPVKQGTYDGRPVTIPMRAGKAAPPIGLSDAELPGTEPEFGAYVVRRE